MRVVIPSVVMLMLVSEVIAYLATSTAHGNHSGTIQEPASQEFHFAPIRSGESVAHTFVLTNPTANPLLISSIRATCGCLIPKETPREVPSHGRCEIPVVLDSHAKS